MKVYAVVGEDDYEGCSAPEGIYSTRERAEAAVQRAAWEWAKISHSPRHDRVEIMEYDLDDDSESSQSSGLSEGNVLTKVG